MFIRYSKSLNLELRVREGGIKYSCKIGLSQFSQASKCDDKRRTCIVEKRLYFQIKGTFLNKCRKDIQAKQITPSWSKQSFQQKLKKSDIQNFRPKSKKALEQFSLFSYLLAFENAYCWKIYGTKGPGGFLTLLFESLFLTHYDCIYGASKRFW